MQPILGRFAEHGGRWRGVCLLGPYICQKLQWPRYTCFPLPFPRVGELMTLPRVMLADDHTILVEAFRKLLEPHYEVVGTVSDGRALLETAKEVNPDVIVLDIGMPLMNGLEAGRRLKQQMPAIKVIYLTMNDDAALAAEAMRSGASGYLLKSSAATELI